MKKIFSLLFIIVFLPMIVLADSASPSIIGYDAVVTNKNGAKVDNYNDGDKKIIPYNTKIHVYDEYDGRAIIQCYDDIKPCDISGDVSIKDITPLEKEIKPNNKDFEKYYKEIIIFNKEGAKLHTGPALAYDVYEEVIPYQKAVKVTYAYMSYDPTGSYYSWYYVNDGKYKGWLDVSDSGQYINDIMLFEKAIMTDEDNKEILTIPSETVIEELFSIYGSSKYYLKYKDKVGYLDDVSFGSKITGYAVTTMDTVISGNGKKTYVPIGTVLKLTYGSYDENHGYIGPVAINEKEEYYYTEYSGVKGFINVNSIFDDEEEIYKTNVTISSNTDMYEYNGDNYFDSENKKLVETIPANTTISLYYEYESGEYDEENDTRPIYGLVLYKGKFGWIRRDSASGKVRKQEIEPKKEIKPNPVKTTNNTLIYAIIAGVLLSVTALGIILVINKKKKKTKLDTKKVNVKNKKNEEK